MNKQKRAKRALLALAIAATLLEMAGIAALAYAYRDMRHEGLTYSQWYEGSVAGFYSCLLAVIFLTSVMIVIWYAFIRYPRTAVLSPRKRQALQAASLALLCAFCALAVLSLKNLDAWRAAEKAAQEGATYYIRAYGRFRIAALLSLEGLCLCAFPLVQEGIRRRKGRA